MSKTKDPEGLFKKYNFLHQRDEEYREWLNSESVEKFKSMDKNEVIEYCMKHKSFYLLEFWREEDGERCFNDMMQMLYSDIIAKHDVVKYSMRYYELLPLRNHDS